MRLAIISAGFGHTARGIEAMHHALKTYESGEYSGNVLLFRANRQPPGAMHDRYLGWREHVSGSIDVVEVNGYHANIVMGPRLRYLVGTFENKLLEAQRQYAQS